MKKLLLAAICALPGLSMAQVLLFNDGATIKIDPGAVLYVEGGVTNTATGLINNDGTLEIQGDFLNSGNYDNAQANTLKFSGTGLSTVTPGSAMFHQVVIAKTGNNVNLAGPMTVTNNLDFAGTNASKLSIGNHNLILNATTTTTGMDADEYIVTTGNGFVQKNITANGSYTFEVGDATNYSKLASTWTSSTYSSANIKVRVNNATHPNKPSDATDFISRNWDVDAIGVNAANYTNTLTGTYINTAEDVTGTASLIKGASYNGTVWSYADAAGATGTVTGKVTATTADFTGTNFFGKANLVAFLQGAYNTSTGVMSTTLNTAGLIPLNSPYADAPASVGSIPSGVTDWIKLELRDPANPATVLGKASAFIKNNGSIVGLDGTSLPSIKNGLPISVVAVVHRTHLSIRTPNAGIDVVNPTLHDFSASLSNAYDNPSNSTNDAMKFNASTSDYIMWAGNGNSNTNVRFSGPSNDRDYLLNTILGGNPTTILSNVYSTGDYNMNGTVRFSGPANDRDFLLNTVLSGNPTTIVTQHF